MWAEQPWADWFSLYQSFSREAYLYSIVLQLIHGVKAGDSFNCTTTSSGGALSPAGAPLWEGDKCHIHADPAFGCYQGKAANPPDKGPCFPSYLLLDLMVGNIFDWVVVAMNRGWNNNVRNMSSGVNRNRYSLESSHRGPREKCKQNPTKSIVIATKLISLSWLLCFLSAPNQKF